LAKGIVLDDKSVPGSVGQTNPLPVRVKDGITGNDISPATEGGNLALILAQFDMKVSALATALEDITVVVSSLIGIKNIAGTEINPATEDGNLANIKTAIEIIDNFISGSRGLVTEDNSVAIKTALEVIDNFISGSRGLVTEDNSATIASRLATLGVPTTTNVTLTNADTDYKLPSSELANRRLIIITNNSAYDVYIGQTGVIDADSSPPVGILLPAGGSLSLDNSTLLYAQCDTAGVKLTVTEFA
jgi:hypothetical protein